MQILYKCRCMAAEVDLWVRDRKPTEDILVWMETAVTPAIGADHQRRAPICAETKMEYAKIPLPEGSPGIGQRPA